MITTIIASGKRGFIPRTSCVPATRREDGTVARETAAVPWWFPSMAGFRSSVSSVGASAVPGETERQYWETMLLSCLFQVPPSRCLHQCRNVHWLDSRDFVLARPGQAGLGRSYFNLLETRSRYSSTGQVQWGQGETSHVVSCWICFSDLYILEAFVIVVLIPL